MSNPNRSMLDTNQLAKLVIDEKLDAIRIIYAENHEMAIALSAEENDSVQAVARSRSGLQMQCDDLREVSLFITGPGVVTLYLSPDREGDDWYKRQQFECTGPSPQAFPAMSISAARLKIEADSGVLVKVFARS